MKLKYKADLFIAYMGQVFFFSFDHGFAIDKQFALIIGIHSGKDIQQSRFTTTRFSGNGNKLPFVY